MRTVTTKYPTVSHSADLMLRTENIKDYTVSVSHLCSGLTWYFFFPLRHSEENEYN